MVLIEGDLLGESDCVKEASSDGGAVGGGKDVKKMNSVARPTGFAQAFGRAEDVFDAALLRPI